MDLMKTLISKLNKASEYYYNGQKIVMTDKEWDSLYDELVELEKKTGIIYSNSPTQKVGYEVKDGLGKVEHTQKMLSLNKTKSIEELKRFTDKETVLSWKEDGLTIVLKYMNGEFTQGITRGNGVVGSDITHNVKTFKNIPMKIDCKGYLEIRGEGLISKSDFEVLNNKGEYKNPRNLTSGSIMFLDSEIASKRELQFKGFKIVESEENFKLYTEQLEWMKDKGFEIVEYKVVTPETIEKAVLEFKDEIESYNFATDGLVVMINDLEYGENLGVTAKHPNNAIAFKWEDEKEETILRDIQFQVGRTGSLTPVGIFDEVELDGSTVSKASIHNISILKELELGIGDTITVYKANAIIPQIEENLTKSNAFEIPTKCPECDNTLMIEKSEKAEFLICNNINCKGRLVQKLSHYCSRNCMNIDDISEATIETFINMGIVNGVLDLYTLEEHRDKIVNMSGFGVKSYNNIIKSVEKSKSVKLYSFIFALGIDLVGNETARLICKHFNDSLDAIKNVSIVEFMNIDGVGDKTAESIYKWLRDKENSVLIDKLSEILTFEKEKEVVVLNSNNILNGKSVYPTGTFTLKKNDLKVKLQELGAITESGYKKSLDYLIVGSIKGSSKEDKAIKDGINIIKEEDLLELIK